MMCGNSCVVVGFGWKKVVEDVLRLPYSLLFVAFLRPRAYRMGVNTSRLHFENQRGTGVCEIERGMCVTRNGWCWIEGAVVF